MILPYLLLMAQMIQLLFLKKQKFLKHIIKANNLPFSFYPLIDKLHGPWGAKVDNKSLSELAFDFMVEYQNLNVN